MKIHENTSKNIKKHQNTSKNIKIHQNTSKYIKIHQNTSKYIKIHQNTSKYLEIAISFGQDWTSSFRQGTHHKRQPTTSGCTTCHGQAATYHRCGLFHLTAKHQTESSRVQTQHTQVTLSELLGCTRNVHSTGKTINIGSALFQKLWQLLGVILELPPAWTVRPLVQGQSLQFNGLPGTPLLSKQETYNKQSYAKSGRLERVTRC